MIVLRTLATMGPQHAYQIALRLKQISDHRLLINQGTLYPALVRLEQCGWIKSHWGKTDHNREAKFYELTRSGRNALNRETEQWNATIALVSRLLEAR